MLIDYLALGIQLKDIVGERLGVSDSTRYRGCGSSFLRTNDTRDNKVCAVFGCKLCTVKERIVTEVLPYRKSVAVGGIGLNKVIGGIEKLELHSDKIAEFIGLHGS